MDRKIPEEVLEEAMKRYKEAGFKYTTDVVAKKTIGEAIELIESLGGKILWWKKTVKKDEEE